MPKNQFRQGIVLAIALFLLLVLWIFRPQEEPFTPNHRQQTLDGLVVVIDPGHGGVDPGSHGVFNGKLVYEAPYVMDVALRLVATIEARGGITLLTRHTPGIETPRDISSDVVLPLSRHDIFTSDGSPVRAKEKGMKPRLAIARQMLNEYPRHRVVFISIHFDVLPEAMQGAYVIAPSETHQRLAGVLINALSEAKRLRRRCKDEATCVEHMPLLVNGTARNLYVLRADKNPVQDRALIELGNFNNKADVWRIRNPGIRQEYAEIITNALERLERED